MIDPSAWDGLDEQVILLLRLVAFIAFLILFGGAFSHTRMLAKGAVRRAGIAISVLWIAFAYIQAAAIWARLTNTTGMAIPISIAVASCLAAVVSVWSLWPWRRE